MVPVVAVIATFAVVVFVMAVFAVIVSVVAGFAVVRVVVVMKEQFVHVEKE